MRSKHATHHFYLYHTNILQIKKVQKFLVLILLIHSVLCPLKSTARKYREALVEEKNLKAKKEYNEILKKHEEEMRRYNDGFFTNVNGGKEHNVVIDEKHYGYSVNRSELARDYIFFIFTGFQRTKYNDLVFDEGYYNKLHSNNSNTENDDKTSIYTNSKSNDNNEDYVIENNSIAFDIESQADLEVDYLNKKYHNDIEKNKDIINNEKDDKQKNLIIDSVGLDNMKQFEYSDYYFFRDMMMNTNNGFDIISLLGSSNTNQPDVLKYPNKRNFTISQYLRKVRKTNSNKYRVCLKSYKKVKPFDIILSLNKKELIKESIYTINDRNDIKPKESKRKKDNSNGNSENDNKEDIIDKRDNEDYRFHSIINIDYIFSHLSQTERDILLPNSNNFKTSNNRNNKALYFNYIKESHLILKIKHVLKIIFYQVINTTKDMNIESQVNRKYREYYNKEINNSIKYNRINYTNYNDNENNFKDINDSNASKFKEFIQNVLNKKDIYHFLLLYDFENWGVFYSKYHESINQEIGISSIDLGFAHTNLNNKDNYNENNKYYEDGKKRLFKDNDNISNSLFYFKLKQHYQEITDIYTNIQKLFNTNDSKKLEFMDIVDKNTFLNMFSIIDHFIINLCFVINKHSRDIEELKKLYSSTTDSSKEDSLKCYDTICVIKYDSVIIPWLPYLKRNLYNNKDKKGSNLHDLVEYISITYNNEVLSTKLYGRNINYIEVNISNYIDTFKNNNNNSRINNDLLGIINSIINNYTFKLYSPHYKSFNKNEYLSTNTKIIISQEVKNIFTALYSNKECIDTNYRTNKENKIKPKQSNRVYNIYNKLRIQNYEVISKNKIKEDNNNNRNDKDISKNITKNDNRNKITNIVKNKTLIKKIIYYSKYVEFIKEDYVIKNDVIFLSRYYDRERDKINMSESINRYIKNIKYIDNRNSSNVSKSKTHSIHFIILQYYNKIIKAYYDELDLYYYSLYYLNNSISTNKLIQFSINLNEIIDITLPGNYSIKDTIDINNFESKRLLKERKNIITVIFGTYYNWIDENSNSIITSLKYSTVTEKLILSINRNQEFIVLIYLNIISFKELLLLKEELTVTRKNEFKNKIFKEIKSNSIVINNVICNLMSNKLNDYEIKNSNNNTKTSDSDSKDNVDNNSDNNTYVKNKGNFTYDLESRIKISRKKYEEYYELDKKKNKTNNNTNTYTSNKDQANEQNKNNVNNQNAFNESNLYNDNKKIKLQLYTLNSSDTDDFDLFYYNLERYKIEEERLFFYLLSICSEIIIE